MPKRFELCILHIGTEKTGTSTLQNFLEVNRKKLLNDGIVFPKHFNSGQGSQWEYVAASLPGPWSQDVGKAFGIGNQQDHMQFLEMLSKNLHEQFAKNLRARTLLISSEHFHSRLNTIQSVQNLKTLLDPWVENFKIIVYFRRQDELACGYFSTRIKSGYQGDDAILPQAGKLHSYYQYDALVDRWCQIFGKQALMPVLYAQVMKAEGTIIYDFCRQCKIRLFRKKIPKHINHSVNAAGLKFIQTMCKTLEGKTNTHNKDSKNEIISLITELFPGPMYVLNKEAAKTLVELFNESNEAVRQKYFPDQPSPLFSSDFDSYPDTAEQLTDDYTQAVEIALKLWDHTRSTPQTSLASRVMKSIKRRLFKR